MVYKIFTANFQDIIFTFLFSFRLSHCVHFMATILPIYTYDHPVLKQTSTPVQDISDEIVQFVNNMFATMRNADGIGLAANQVGSTHAITVIDLSDMEDDRPVKTPQMTLINPVIQAVSDEHTEFEEGCLSLPNFRDKITRPEKIQVRFYDMTMKEHTLEADGLLARVIQHEVDHLNGIYFFEHLNQIRRAMAHPKLKRIQLGHIETEYPVFNTKHATKPKKRR